MASTSVIRIQEHLKFRAVAHTSCILVAAATMRRLKIAHMATSSHVCANRISSSLKNSAGRSGRHDLAYGTSRCEKIWHQWAGAHLQVCVFGSYSQPRRPQRSAPAELFHTFRAVGKSTIRLSLPSSRPEKILNMSFRERGEVPIST